MVVVPSAGALEALEILVSSGLSRVVFRPLAVGGEGSATRISSHLPELERPRCWAGVTGRLFSDQEIMTTGGTVGHLVPVTVGHHAVAYLREKIPAVSTVRQQELGSGPRTRSCTVEPARSP